MILYWPKFLISPFKHVLLPVIIFLISLIPIFFGRGDWNITGKMGEMAVDPLMGMLIAVNPWKIFIFSLAQIPLLLGDFPILVIDVHIFMLVKLVLKPLYIRGSILTHISPIFERLEALKKQSVPGVTRVWPVWCGCWPLEQRRDGSVWRCGISIVSERVIEELLIFL